MGYHLEYHGGLSFMPPPPFWTVLSFESDGLLVWTARRRLLQSPEYRLIAHVPASAVLAIDVVPAGLRTPMLGAVAGTLLHMSLGAVGAVAAWSEFSSQDALVVEIGDGRQSEAGLFIGEDVWTARDVLGYEYQLYFG